MDHQNTEAEAKSATELLREEADTHDKEYASEYPYPFLSNNYDINVEHVLYTNDYCYKPGRFVAGYRRRRLFELIELESLDGKRILDVGCGNGQFSVFFAMHGAEVHGFDISEVGVQIGRRTANENNVSNNTIFTVQSATDLAFKDESFDLIVCNAVLHHLLKYEGFEEELYRVLSNEGQLVFANSIRDNPVYNFERSIYRKLGGEEPKGDGDVEYNDYSSFCERYNDVHIERFTLLFGIKELWLC